MLRHKSLFWLALSVFSGPLLVGYLGQWSVYAPSPATGQHALDDLGQPSTARFGKTVDWLWREVSHRWEPPASQTAVPLLGLMALGVLVRAARLMMPTRDVTPAGPAPESIARAKLGSALASEPTEKSDSLPLGQNWSVVAGLVVGLLVVGLYSYYPEPESLRRDLMEARADVLLALTQRNAVAYRDAARHSSVIISDLRVSAVLWLASLSPEQSAALTLLDDELTRVAPTLDETEPSSYQNAYVRLARAYRDVQRAFPAGGRP